MRRIPLWLKLAFTLWMLVWVPAYWLHNGAANFLWLCDLMNFLLLVGLWRESRLLLSSQAVAGLLVGVLWSVDLLAALVAGVHPLGATAYMFEADKPLFIRLLSLFHLTSPAIAVWGAWRLGYDRRGWLLQSAIAWVVLPLSLLPDPGRNLNWVHAPFGLEQTLMPTGAFLAVLLAAYPLLIYLPTHLALARVLGGALPGSAKPR